MSFFLVKEKASQLSSEKKNRLVPGLPKIALDWKYFIKIWETN